MTKHADIEYPSFIFDTFHNIYFTDEENKWLDQVITNIGLLENKHKRALAFFALFQSCIIKRPYNLFHRKNLYVRTAEVERSFGNKKTWDTPFEKHFIKFVNEANNAVFDNKKNNLAFQNDIFEWSHTKPDLVYIDTPYISKNGVGVNYFDFYHFLEGIVKYDEWPNLIDHETKHKKIKNGKNEWCNKGEIHSAFKTLFNKMNYPAASGRGIQAVGSLSMGLRVPLEPLRKETSQQAVEEYSDLKILSWSYPIVMMAFPKPQN